MYLLDTDILIDIQRSYAPALAWFTSLIDLPSVPGFVVMELIQDAQNARQSALLCQEEWGVSVGALAVSTTLPSASVIHPVASTMGAGVELVGFVETAGVEL